MTTYSIETGHGDEICSGISGRGRACNVAQDHADKRGEPVWVQGDDGDSIEIVPREDDN